tara:strand:+ start:24 stop:302 length:279 start_codon:yes stop_codon:yes gene_type:complete
MKLTESRIKQIILEELHNLAEEEQEEQPPTSGAEEPKAYPEVEVIMRLMPKINSFKKYQQLIEKVLAHNFDDEQGKLRVLKALKIQLSKSLS